MGKFKDTQQVFYLCKKSGAISDHTVISMKDVNDACKAMVTSDVANDLAIDTKKSYEQKA